MTALQVSPAWLALREPADAAARASELIDELRCDLPGDKPGTGPGGDSPRSVLMAREIDARETRFGRYLEDFQVGDVYKHWPG